YGTHMAAPSAPRQTFRTQQNHLAFWSTAERRWKTVPHANVKAAQSAAAEVDQYLGKSQFTQNSLSSAGFSQLEVNTAIDKAAARHNVDANLRSEEHTSNSSHQIISYAVFCLKKKTKEKKVSKL